VETPGAETALGPRVERPHVLREYALLADGERGVLVGPRGEFVWMCFPRWHDDALFSSLVGGRGGYAITPQGRLVWGGYYEPGTLIWTSRWVTERGVVECREALALPTSPERAVLLRQVKPRTTSARLEVVLDLRARFGRETMRDLERGDDGTWRGRVGGVCFSWTGGASAHLEQYEDGGDALILPVELEAGEQHDLVLVLEVGGLPRAPDPEVAWGRTEAEWRRRVPVIDRTVAERDSRHAYAVLSGLTSEGGGTVAAATTSLPERAEQGRNYDYRYVWIRDQCYTGQAVARHGAHRLMDDAVRFVRERLLADGPELKPAYTVTGREVPDEHRVGLAGYPGGGDTVGNRIGSQFQLDAFGEALLLFAAAARHDRLDADDWHAAELAADAIAQRWREPDAGIWETGLHHWTHGRLMCAAGLRAMAERRRSGERAAAWLSLAEAMTADVATSAVHPSGRWQRAPDDERLDAALLLPAVRGAVPSHDPRSVATLRAVERELTSDGFVYRYRPDERPLGTSEGAFLLCGFFMALACSQQRPRRGGPLVRAQQIRLRATGLADRGVRCHGAPATWKPPTSLRSCAPARNRGRTVPDGCGRWLAVGPEAARQLRCQFPDRAVKPSFFGFGRRVAAGRCLF